MSIQSIFYLEVEKIKPNPYQPRRSFDEVALAELAESVRAYGILEPLIVARVERETPAGLAADYQLIAGERRLMAAKLVGLSTVPAIIREGDTERAKLEIALIENLQREDLNPMERSRAFARLADEFGLAQREIAFRVGKSREWVANTMRLLGLPPEVQKALEEGKITEGHCRVFLSVASAEEQHRLLEIVVAKRLTVREALAYVEGRGLVRRKASVLPRVAEEDDPAAKDLAARLEQTLGARVVVRNKDGQRGEISIVYHTPEEFDAIVQKIIGGASS